MRTSSLACALSLSLSLSLFACSAPSADAESASASSIESSQTSFPKLCLIPKGHPFNLNGPAFTLDANQLQRATMFYWHGMPSELGGGGGTIPPSESWTVDASQVTETTVHFEGHEIATHAMVLKTFTLDLVRVADDPVLGWWNQVHMKGTLVVHDVIQPDHADEVVEIVRSPECANL
jgi:hypothetical protein